MIITSTEIEERFDVPVLVPDVHYFVPSKKWLLKTFYNWYQNQLFSMGLSYRKNFDCDKFARGYAWLASVCLGAMYTNGIKSDGIAVGEVFYSIAGNRDRGHAINCAFIDNKKLVFIEPQTGKIVKLSKAEKDSIDFVRF